MHSPKAHVTSVPQGREQSFDVFAHRSALTLLAAIANGSAWWMLSLFVCSFFENLTGSILPFGVGLVSGCASLIVLLAAAKCDRAALIASEAVAEATREAACSGRP